jgi:hypothetical protein
MPLTIGNGTITGLDAGGLNDSIIIGNTFASDTLSLSDFASSVWSSSKTSEGYQYFAGGVLIQWGRFNNRIGTSVTITFPISFPTAALNLYATQQAGGDTGGVGAISLIRTLPSTTSASLSIQQMTTDPSTGHWLCIGY